MGLKVYTYMNFYLVYAQRKRKKVIQNSHLFILEKGQIYDSQPCIFNIFFLSGPPLSPYFLFRLSWNIFTSWKFNHYMSALWTTIYITSKRGKLLLFLSYIVRSVHKKMTHTKVCITLSRYWIVKNSYLPFKVDI